MPEFWRLIGKRPLPRIHLLSDLHLETGPYVIPPGPDYDVLIAAGDIGPVEQAVKWLASLGKPVVYVLGNAPMYGCSHHHNRGLAVCSNKHKVYQEEAESAVLDCLQKQIMTPHTVDQIVEQALHAVKEAMKKPDHHQEQIKGLQADLAESRRILERLSQALTNTNTPLETVLEMLGKQEQRKKLLEQELEGLQRVIRPKAFDESRLRRLLASRIEDFRGLMLGDVATAPKRSGHCLKARSCFRRWCEMARKR